ncbi:hypothetical protein VTO73DRAFT_8605 [Trametes versicolor]
MLFTIAKCAPHGPLSSCRSSIRADDATPDAKAQQLSEMPSAAGHAVRNMAATGWTKVPSAHGVPVLCTTPDLRTGLSADGIPKAGLHPPSTSSIYPRRRGRPISAQSVRLGIGPQHIAVAWRHRVHL